MIGENTLLMTPHGFKRLKELKLFDKVLTMYGTFEPIVYMSEWKDMTHKMTNSLGESFAVTDDLLLASNGEVSFISLKNVVKNNYKFGFMNILHNVSYNKRDSCTYSEEELYQMAVVVPSSMPKTLLYSSLEKRMAFMAGLIDSPMCAITEIEGVYTFYVAYDDFLVDFITLVRSLGWCIELSNNRTVIVKAIGSLLPIDLPIRDNYKVMSGQYSGYKRCIGIKSVTSEKMLGRGREIAVSGNSFLIGHSLIPIISSVM